MGLMFTGCIVKNTPSCHSVDRLKADYEDDATAKRDAEKERIRKKRDEGQFMMAFVMPAAELPTASASPS